MTSERSSEGMPSRSERRERLFDLLEELEVARERGATIELRDLCDGDVELAEEAGLLASRLELVIRTLDAPLRIEAPAFVAFSLKLNIVRPLGRGGQGRVYLAFDETLKREVAVKTSHFRDEASALRLRKEAEIASRLNHPGVVPVFGVGVTEIGLPFLAMRYIPGVTLDHFLAEIGKALSAGKGEAAARRALRAFAEVCRTVAFVHDRGIVHCDLKPGNVLIGDSGETVLLDWGLSAPAKSDASAIEAIEVSHGSTLRGHAWDHGTTEFMSPERIERRGDIGPWIDIYSLGVILDRIVRGPSKRSAGGDQAPPRYEIPFRTTIDGALRSLADQACATKPRERPSSALHLAAAVESELTAPSLLKARRRGGLFGFLARPRP